MSFLAFPLVGSILHCGIPTSLILAGLLRLGSCCRLRWLPKPLRLAGAGCHSCGDPRLFADSELRSPQLRRLQTFPEVAGGGTFEHLGGRCWANSYMFGSNIGFAHFGK